MAMNRSEQLDLRIEHDTACTGALGKYAATLFHMDRNGFLIVQTPLTLGEYDEIYESPIELLERTRQLAEEKRRHDIPTEKCIALNAARLCVRKRHQDSPNISDKSAGRIERVAALVVAQKPRMNVRIRPLNVDESRELIQNHGIGHVRRHDPYPYLAGLAVVCLPITREESRKFMVVDAARAAASATSLSRKPHVILHRRGTAETLEQIVTLDELQ